MKYTVTDISVSTSNPHYKIVQGYFIRDDGEKVMMTYYEENNLTDYENGEWGCEYYVGENYIPESKAKSYSRNYKHCKNFPKKYNSVKNELVSFYAKHEVEQIKKELSCKVL